MEKKISTFKKRVTHRKIILGVDRLDYTKGVDKRLDAFELLLKTKRIKAKEVVLFQVAVPSREKVQEYALTKRDIEQRVGRINGDFSETARSPVQYVHRNIPFKDLIAMYCAADVMLVSPLKDGMNLVAKEYVASHTDESGVLILSEFAGAAESLRDSILINPYDIHGMANAMELALHLPQEEIQRKMKSLRKIVKNNDVYKWAQIFLKALK
jgi:trehalose 6-phosphate synthase